MIWIRKKEKEKKDHPFFFEKEKIDHPNKT